MCTTASWNPGCGFCRSRSRVMRFSGGCASCSTRNRVDHNGPQRIRHAALNAGLRQCRGPRLRRSIRGVYDRLARASSCAPVGRGALQRLHHWQNRCTSPSARRASRASRLQFQHHAPLDILIVPGGAVTKELASPDVARWIATVAGCTQVTASVWTSTQRTPIFRWTRGISQHLEQKRTASRCFASSDQNVPARELHVTASDAVVARSQWSYLSARPNILVILLCVDSGSQSRRDLYSALLQLLLEIPVADRHFVPLTCKRQYRASPK